MPYKAKSGGRSDPAVKTKIWIRRVLTRYLSMGEDR
jgi:hypothetical protein